MGRYMQQSERKVCTRELKNAALQAHPRLEVRFLEECVKKGQTSLKVCALLCQTMKCACFMFLMLQMGNLQVWWLALVA